MPNWLRKTIVGLMAASGLYTCGYVGGGAFYDVYRTASYTRSNGKGYYNRSKDSSLSFRREFLSETLTLERKIILSVADKQYTLDILVSENVKLFFDDDGNPNDNDRWAKYVKESVESLKEYSKAGIGFKVREVIGVNGDTLNDWAMYLTSRVNKEYDPSHIDLAFIPMDDLKSEEGVAGWAVPDENFAIVTIGDNGHRNRTLVLHEIGHLLRLQHKKINDMKRLFWDPYCVFYTESFMSSRIDPCTSESLKQDEIDYLKYVHSK